MVFRFVIVWCLVWLSAVVRSAVAGGSALDCVDPLIGTEGAGSEYGGMMPYVCEPFGSFQLVPMTRLNRVGQLSFNNADDTLLGFILTRQPAIWMGDWGEVRIPIGPAKIESAKYTPYYGRVTAGGRTFEYTATAHAAWLRGDLHDVRLADGYNASRDDADLGYPLPNFKGWRCVRADQDGLRVGVSLISLEQARANLAREIGLRSFDEVVSATKAKWEAYFARVEIDAPDDVRTIFYTGLFHTLLYPRQMDEDGRYYSAMDDRVHEGTRYNCYSLWDTYRAEHPWLTLVAPERVDGMMRSLLDMYREGGWLPKWPNPSYTGIMTGAPAEIVLQEAMVKGFMGFDHALAREAIRKNATVPQVGDTAHRWEDRGRFGRTPETRAGLTSYLKRGYVACDETSASVSRTLDFALADRNRNYTNLWNAAVRGFRPRRSDGVFRDDRWGPYTECSPATALWCVPHDPQGLMTLLGGRDAYEAELDRFFDEDFFKADHYGTSLHGNEPNHHIPYMYNACGAWAKTQRTVRRILTSCYSTSRKGFEGNEDCGQMSAWYLFSALGFYPLDPASGEYELGSPLVRGATLRFDAPYAPATLRIVVKDYAPDRWRVRRVTLNGRELTTWRVRHADLVKGGELVFEMDARLGMATNVCQILSSTLRHGRDELRACVTGMVVATLYGDRFLLDDGTGTLHVKVLGSPCPPCGSSVSVAGAAYVDAFLQTQFVTTNVACLGTAEPPPPQEVTVAELAAGKGNRRPVRTEGRVVEARRDSLSDSWSYLALSDGAETVYVTVPDGNGEVFDPKCVLDATVRVTGVAMADHAGPRRHLGPHVELKGASGLEVLTPAPADPFAAPPIDGDLRYSPAAVQRLGHRTQRGFVLATWGGRHILFASGANPNVHRVDLLPGQPLPAHGERILVAGKVETDLLHLNFSHARWRHLSDDAMPDAFWTLTLRDMFPGARMSEHLIFGHGAPVVLRGTVVLEPNDDGRAVLSCEGVRVTYDISSVPELADRLPLGAVVIVKGRGLMEIEDWHPDAPLPEIGGFSVIACTSGDVEVVSRPSWWTPARLGVAVAALLALVGALILWIRLLQRLVEQRGRRIAEGEVARAAADLRADERTRLAVELHDALSQTLTGVACQLDAVERFRTEDPARMHGCIELARRTVHSCRNELKNCLWDLRNRTLEEADTQEAIRRTLKPHKGGAELTVDCDIPRGRLTDTTFHELLCILRELVVNAVRHGHAAHIAVKGRVTDALRLSVTDDGVGFDPASRPGAAEGHFGLLGVSERVWRLGGTLRIVSAPGQGATFEITICRKP